MNRTLLSYFPLIFSLFLSACVSQADKSQFNLQQAAKARVEVGLGYLAQHNFEQAKLNIDKAISYTPNHYLPHSALAYFYQKQGLWEKAQTAYLTALKLDENQGDVLNNYGVFLCERGEFEQAYLHLQKALEAKAYYQQADTYENLAICAFSANNTALYQENLQRLTHLQPERAKQLAQRLKGKN